MLLFCFCITTQQTNLRMLISDRLTSNRLNNRWPVSVHHNRCLNFGLRLVCHHCSITQQSLLYTLSNKCPSASPWSRLQGPYLRCMTAWAWWGEMMIRTSKVYGSGGCIYDSYQVVSLSRLMSATSSLTVDGPVRPSAAIDMATGTAWLIHTGESLPVFFCQQCNAQLCHRCCGLCYGHPVE